MPEILRVTAETFDSMVLASSRPVLVDFYADWCGPCRALQPALEDVAREFDGEVTVVKLNVDDEPPLAARYGVQGIPALLLFDAGQVADRLTGVASRTAMAGVIEKCLGSRK